MKRIALNIKKFAEKCYDVMHPKVGMSRDSSSIPLLYQISRCWRKALNATNFKGDESGGWREKEEAVGEIIIIALAYLRHIGCNDIDRLLKDLLRRQKQDGDRY